MNTAYIHSVSLDADKCTGCTTCMKHCPTEAIRIRGGCAEIDAERCIDCGECIRNCTHNAKKSICNLFDEINSFKYKIALPAPSLFAQFDNLDNIGYVLQGLLDIGFDDVFEVAKGAELVSAYTRLYLQAEGIKKPVISTACPVVTRLIVLRFPFLKDNLIPLLPPMEVAAALARKKAMNEHPELKREDIGVCFISPCPAKMSYARTGFGSYKSEVDLVISMSEIYFQLLNVMKREKVCDMPSQAGRIGLSWAICGGEASALINDKIIAADGINNVISVLDQIEDGNIPPVDFVELNACNGGCVGGVLNVENPFVAKARIRALRKNLKYTASEPIAEDKDESFYLWDKMPEVKDVFRLDENRRVAMQKLAVIENVLSTLPGLDCGGCGAPSCRAFAEDVAANEVSKDECVRYEK